MHTCQIMLVEADSGDDAIAEVQTQITYSETPYPSWSDWHEVGGRWEGLFAGWEETRNALAYSENPTLAEDIIQEFVAVRKIELERALEQMAQPDFDIREMAMKYDPNKYDYGFSMNAWTLTKVGKLLSNSWCSDTGVFDLKEGSCTLEYFRERLKTDPTRQYLVPIDFHF